MSSFLSYNELMRPESLGSLLSGGGAAAGGAGTLGFLAGPYGMALTTGVGLLQGILQGSAQKRHYKEIAGRIKETMSSEYLAALERAEMDRRGGEFAEISRGAQVAAQTSSGRTRARYSRMGLTGVGEAVGQTAEIGAYMTARNTMSRLKLEVAGMAKQQQENQLRALQGLLGTPYGGVSPASAAIAGAGAGLEAAANAAYANQLAGRKG